MITKGLFSQIIIVIISVAIIFAYIHPTLTNVEAKQDDIQIFKSEVEKVMSVNSLLGDLVTDLESVTINERDWLLTYLPTTVDEVAVMRHLLLISERAGVSYVDSSYGDIIDLEAIDGSDESDLIAHTFELQVDGSYQQIKELLRLIELNEYPLEVHNLNISQLNGFLLSANLTLVTYQFNDSAGNFDQPIN